MYYFAEIKVTTQTPHVWFTCYLTAMSQCRRWWCFLPLFQCFRLKLTHSREPKLSLICLKSAKSCSYCRPESCVVFHMLSKSKKRKDYIVLRNFKNIPWWAWLDTSSTWNEVVVISSQHKLRSVFVAGSVRNEALYSSLIWQKAN